MARCTLTAEQEGPRRDAPPPRPKGPLWKGIRPLDGSISYIHPQIDNLTDAQLSALLRDAGLCSDAATDDWFPIEPTTECGRLAYEQEAKRRCAGCPVVNECLLLALRFESRPYVKPHGIWGGTAPWEREATLRSLARKHGSREAARNALGVAA